MVSDRKISKRPLNYSMVKYTFVLRADRLQGLLDREWANLKPDSFRYQTLSEELRKLKDKLVLWEAIHGDC